MDFDEFKNSEPAKSIFAQLGMADLLHTASSWHLLRRMVVDFNNRTGGPFVRAVEKVDGISSSGERVLLHAVCRATDFAWLADELADGRAWRTMDNASGEWRQAVVACIVCRD